ncbi:hypothetical protein ABEF95_006867 [Exophiala dermatitidis]
MAANVLTQVVKSASFYAFGVFNWFLYLAFSVQSGAFFKRDSEQDKLQYAIARDQFWNLSQAPFPGFTHFFYTLRNDVKLHYISNRDGPSSDNLIVLLHGFPDSSMLWRYLLREPAMPASEATIVCVDLPGFGGSDSLKAYDTEVLEALTEFVIAMRDKYISSEDSGSPSTYIVGHDWGCVLGFRLAAEAPYLADRFILTNAPYPEHAFANKDRVLNSASKIFKQFMRSPRQNFGCLSKSFKTLKPLLWQTFVMGYIFVFNLPPIFVKSLGVGGNYSFIRGCHRFAYGRGAKEYPVQEAMAATFGPSPQECKTSTVPSSNAEAGETYGPTVLERARSPAEAFWNMTGYYRDGAATRPWVKSLETIADLYALEEMASRSSSVSRRSSVSNSLFAEPVKGSLKAPTYVLWGENDTACSRPICLDGLGDYLGKDSEVTILPRSGHWTPIERESRPALALAIASFAKRHAEPVPNMTANVRQVYPDAVLMAKK